MRTFGTLVLREWLEWRRVIVGIILVITFLNLLALITVNRGGRHLQSELDTNGHIYFEDIKIENDENGEQRFSMDLRVEGDRVEVDIEHLEGEGVDQEDIDRYTKMPAIPLAWYLMVGMQFLFATVLFLALFYFADAVYKERSDNSTLFYRSLPVSDHMILGSKVAAGMLGIIGLTLVLSLEFLFVSRIALLLLREPISSFAALTWKEINLFSAMWDWTIYLLVSTTRLLPMALFLMMVSAWVKGRPLIIGVGGPILAGVAFAIIFGSADLLKMLFELFVDLARMMSEQWLVGDTYTGGGLELYGSFWGYLFSWQTPVLLVVSGGMYAFLVWLYRRNIPTG